MSNEASRRSSTVPFAAADSIPRPPPLPAPRPLQRARDVATRLFGYQSRPPSPQEVDLSRRSGRSRFASLGATENATASHKTGLEINTIAINEAGTHALLGGKDIFKTIKVEDGKCAEELNLKSVIRSTPNQASGKVRQVYSIDIADVAWAKGDCGDYVAAATSSGKIILYNLGRADLKPSQLHEHFRQVHKVTFNPHRGNLLLSGSQDGTVRLWDVRDDRQASTLKSKHKYSGQADGIRDVKWSPTDGVDFAFGTDSGWIQRWDMRNLKTAKIKVPAHVTTCNTIDWHPDGKHIVSASSDKSVRVWDFSVSRKQKASWEIMTAHPVLNARWRPACESSMPHVQGARQCTQIVTSYDISHPVIHIWDFRRPALPFREMWPYRTAPTDLLWHSQDLLWTVGKDGVFLQADILHAPKVIDKWNLQALDVSPLGELNFATQKRQRPHLPKKFDLTTLPSKSSSLSQSPEQAVLSRSWADDSLDHSFLSVRPEKRQIKTIVKSRTQSLSMTNPNEQARSRQSMISLNEALTWYKSARPVQAGAFGTLPSTRDQYAFSFAARKYKIDFASIPKDDAFLNSFRQALIHNASCANAVFLHRVGKTWAFIEFAVKSHLEKRAKFKKQDGPQKPLEGVTARKSITLSEIARKISGETERSPAPTVASAKPLSSIAQQIVLSDSQSLQRTPQALPASTAGESQAASQNIVPEVEQDDHLALPPSVTSEAPAQSVSNIKANPSDRRLTISNLDGLQKLQLNPDGVDRADMVRRWSVQPKEPLRLDPVDASGVQIPPKLEKRDSADSFTFLAGSVESRAASLPSSLASSPTSLPRPEGNLESPEKEDGGAAAKIAAEKTHVSPTTTTKGEDVTCKQYLPEDGDADIEEDEPFALGGMLRQMVQEASEEGDSQTASHLLLLLAPILPRTHPLSAEENEGTAAAFQECYAAAEYTQKEIDAAFDDHLQPLVDAGLQPLQMEAVMSTYHDDLMKQGLHNEAAVLRNLAYPAFPAVYEDFMQDCEIRIKCNECGKPINTGTASLRCENCNTKQASCAICWCEESPYAQDADGPNTGGKLMTTCLLCNHTTHAACLREWFEGSGEGDGGCPTAGCLCDCVAGSWREEKAKMAEKKRQKGHSRVRSDEWTAQESKAVEGARVALGVKGVGVKGLEKEG